MVGTGGAVGAAEEPKRFNGCRLEPAEWADGDSFPVRFPDNQVRTVRLYGADCPEIHVQGDDSNARRLRAQRRYFAIPEIGPARKIGVEASDFVRESLARPFTVETAFADARGDGRHARIYGFVTTAAGRDLAKELVSRGLARAFGVYRARLDGTSAGEYRAELQDLELQASKAGRGAWALTDWSRLPEERKQARDEEAELDRVRTDAGPDPSLRVNPNTASRDELMALPGIGEKLANRIIEARAAQPFTNAEDLARVPGLGAGTLVERLRPRLVFAPPTPAR
jgi:competence ComEA-like helix-hairpin-helix protein